MKQKSQTKFICLFFVMFSAQYTFGQDSSKAAAPKADTAKPAPPKPQNTLTISVDMRTRTELRHGYRVIPTEDTSIAFFTNQRTRLNFDFKTKKFDFYASLQDTRVWGQQDPREGQGITSPTEATTYPLYMFEVFAEPHFSDKFSVRIGRQRIIYDNQRLYAENDWRLPGNSHDAVRLIFNNRINFATEFTAAYNQYAENNFTTNYKPNGFANYKTLLVHYLNWKLSKNFTLLTLNTADGFQSSLPNDYQTTNMRFTSGGRLEYASYNWYVTFSGYYQYGKDSAGKKLDAYYIQPEIKYNSKAITVRLGLEYLSGHNASKPIDKDNNFVPLYGVAHRFMGNMDLFTTFPADVNNAGLVNPYLFLWYQKGKVFLRCENHLFYSQNDFLVNSSPVKKYLGFENDWRLNYKFNSFSEIETGFSWAAVTDAMITIKKGGDSKAFPYWFYLSLKFTPTIARFSF